MYTMSILTEKIVTFAIAILLMRWWFPNDTKTLGVLKRFHQKAKAVLKKKKKNSTSEETHDKSGDSEDRHGSIGD